MRVAIVELLVVAIAALMMADFDTGRLMLEAADSPWRIFDRGATRILLFIDGIAVGLDAIVESAALLMAGFGAAECLSWQLFDLGTMDWQLRQWSQGLVSTQWLSR
jgi:hypothetical protein